MDEIGVGVLEEYFDDDDGMSSFVCLFYRYC